MEEFEDENDDKPPKSIKFIIIKVLRVVDEEEYEEKFEVVEGDDLKQALVELYIEYTSPEKEEIDDFCQKMEEYDGKLCVEFPLTTGGLVYRASFINIINELNINNLKNKIVGIIDTSSDAELVKLAIELNIIQD